MSHQHEDIFENRKQFQLERMILFSDAVFAIVITLLVIEIRIPEIDRSQSWELQSAELAHRLGELIFHFIGFITSFVVVSIFWQMHHRTFGYVTGYDGGLIWLNLFLLMMVCGLPFTSNLVSTYGDFDLTYIAYSINLGLISLMSFFVWLRISNPKRKLATGMHDANIRNYGRARSLATTTIFFSGALLCMFHNPLLSLIGRFIFFLIFPALSIIKRMYRINHV